MKNPVFSSGLIAVALLLFGCGTTYITVEQFSEKVTKTTDEFTGLTEIRSLKFPLTKGVGNYWFSARKSRGESEYTIYLYVRAWCRGSLEYEFFNQLYDKHQTEFRTLHVSQEETDSGSIVELTATIVPESYIIDWLQEPGLREFMLLGKTERCQFAVFPNEIQGFWEAFQRLK